MVNRTKLQLQQQVGTVGGRGFVGAGMAAAMACHTGSFSTNVSILNNFIYQIKRVYIIACRLLQCLLEWAGVRVFAPKKLAHSRSDWSHRSDRCPWMVWPVRSYSRSGNSHTGLTGRPDRSDRWTPSPSRIEESWQNSTCKGFSCEARPPHPINIKGHSQFRLITQSIITFYNFYFSNPSFYNLVLSLFVATTIKDVLSGLANLRATLGFHHTSAV
jgi:hypothetical protein